jgi:hypothetical protein
MLGESLESIAQRLERAADRSQNSGSMDAANAARTAAQQVLAASSVEAGLAIEQAFLTGYGDVSVAQPARSWWWRLTHPSSWVSGWSSSDDFLSDDS